MKATAFELTAPFDTVTFTGPAVVTSLPGMDTVIVSQFVPDAQDGITVDGLNVSELKCTLEFIESPWPVITSMNGPLPAGTLDGKIELMEGGVGGVGDAIDPPQPDKTVQPTIRKVTKIGVKR